MGVTVEKLTKCFGVRGEVVGVRDVSFDAVEQGITSLLGPSGSGKSTLLRLIAGLEVPSVGRVLLDGVDVSRVPVQRRGIGFVFQSYALFGHMSVFDNVGFGLKVRKEPPAAIRHRVEELLELVQLSDHGHRFPHQLSGGQRQRIALARALAPKPRVLLLDEPFGALDTQVRIELREWLHRLHEQMPVTTILVTHDQEEALELSNRVVLLRDGRIEQVGAPQELYEQPANAFVASFLGGAKVLRGSVLQGRARFPQAALSAPIDLEDGSEVEAFVRPHDVRVHKARSESQDSPVVERVIRVGGFVKLAIALPGGDRLTVQLSRHELSDDFQRGDRVDIDLREINLTPTTRYAI
ncbi:MAG: sulfate/molybdate ABC transporter ATP-binding protein [Polyangiaceae bacterium]